LLAVDLYNRPYGDRYLEAHVVHMHLAWLYLLHAKFEREGTDYEYRDGSGHFIRTKDGEIKRWELSECVRRWRPNESDPVRKNLEFFIGLRNRVEHQQTEAVEAVIAGRAQSNILNYEEALTTLFGDDEGLGKSLRLPLFLSTLTQDAGQAVKRARELLPATVRSYIEDFDNDLSNEILEHPRFDLRLLLVPKLGPKSEADAALEFLRWDELSDDDREKIKDLRNVIVREKQVSVQFKDCMIPSAVAAEVQAAIPFRFAASLHHARCWQYFKVRPPGGDTNPEHTDDKYCIYSVPTKTYVYTLAWVRKLIAELATPESFRAITGCEPTLKSS
jgi:hypothetical protein